MGDINASDFFDQNKLWKEYNVSEKIMAQHLTKFLEPGSLLKFTEMQSFINAGQDREKEFDHDVAGIRSQGDIGSHSNFEEESSEIDDIKQSKRRHHQNAQPYQ